GHEVVFASHCPSGNSGSAELCCFASSQCAVLGGFMGRASAAITAAVQSLWRLWGGSPMGLLGLSPTAKAPLLPEGTAQGTVQRSREGPAPGLLPRAASRAAQGCHGQDRGDGRCER